MGDTTKNVLVDNYSVKRALQEADGHIEPLPCCHGPILAPIPQLDRGSNAAPCTSKPHHRQPTTSTQRSNLWRARNRDAEGNEQKRAVRDAIANVSARRVHITYNASDFSISSTGRVGIHCTDEEKYVDGKDPISFSEFRQRHPQFDLIEWNGKEPMKIFDCRGRNFIHLGGKPTQKSLKTSMNALVVEITRARIDAGIPERLANADDMNRGDHPTATYGYTYPSSKQRPSLLKNGDPKSHKVAIELASLPGAQRIKDLQASMMQSAAPEMYDLYCRTDRIIRENCPELERELKQAIPFIDDPGLYPFASVTYNIGPQTVCRRHRDSMNFGPGWCVVTSLGDYNPKYGGHIVLWELGLIIEFPPGETRMSVVRYSAGGLFTWVANGCQPQKACKCPAKPVSLDTYLDLYRTVHDLDDVSHAFAE